MQQYIPLVAPNLILDTDLRPYVYDRILEASGGTIYDFSPHSPITAIVEGLDFPLRETTSILNRYAIAVAIEHLKTAGIQQRLGTQAKTTLEFTLTAPLSTNFFLSAGYTVTSGALQFTTLENLVIAAGTVTGTVGAIAVNPGSQYNVGIGQINGLTQTRAYLKSVRNIDFASGGTEPETIEQTISRGFESLRARDQLITADDFESEAKLQLGAGSVAKAIGNLGSDRITYELGSVHLFILNADGTPPNQAQCNNLVAAMQSKTPLILNSKTTLIGSGLHVSAIDLVPLKITVVCSMISGDNPMTRSEEIRDELKNYLSPLNSTLGKTVILKEVENVIRQTGVQYIQSVSFQSDTQGESYSDFPLPNKWSAVDLKEVTIALVDDFNNNYQFTYS
jgi:hypothetical protein